MFPLRLYDFDLILSVCLYDVKNLQQLGYIYGNAYWLTMPEHRRTQKKYFDQDDRIIEGLLVEERAAKIRFMKGLFPLVGGDKMVPMMVMLAVSPKEILDALSDDERAQLSQLKVFCRQNFRALTNHNVMPDSIKDYTGYDKAWINTDLYKKGIQSKHSALNCLINEELKPRIIQKTTYDQLVHQASKHMEKGLAAYRQGTDEGFELAIRQWRAAIEIYAKTHQSRGVIYFRDKPIPLIPKAVKIFWNIGNALRQKGDYLGAFENLRLSVNLQSYFDKPVLINKSEQDMQERVSATFLDLKLSFAKKLGLAPKSVTEEEQIAMTN